MTVKVFCGEKVTNHESEWIQFNEVYRTIMEEYGDKEELVYILANFRLPKSQIDIAILMRKGPIIIELKSYKGNIIGNENGEWKVIKDSGEVKKIPKNLFSQISNHRYGLGKKLVDIQKRGVLGHIEEKSLRYQIKAWGYFENGSSYNRDQIGRGAWIWFDIIWKDRLLEKLDTYEEADYNLEERDMMDIVEGLQQQEYDLSDQRMRRLSDPVEKVDDKTIDNTSARADQSLTNIENDILSFVSEKGEVRYKDLEKEITKKCAISTFKKYRKTLFVDRKSVV